MTTTDFGQWWPYIDHGKTSWRVKKENSLHEGKTQINSVWIQTGMNTTANDMSKWNVKKKGVQLAENFKRGWYTCKHDI